MRTTKRILVAACVLALLVTGCFLAAFAASSSSQGSVTELKELVTAAENAKEAGAKYDAVIEVINYVNTKIIDTDEAGYDKVMTRVNEVAVAGADLCLDAINGKNSENDRDNFLKAYELLNAFELEDDVKGFAAVKVKFDSSLVTVANALVNAMDANIEQTLKTATNSIAVNKAKSVLGKCETYAENSAYDALQAEYELRLAAQQRATATNYEKLDNANDINNYDLPVYYTETWQDRKVGMSSENVGGKWSVDLKASKNKAGIGQEADGNKYYAHQYLQADSPVASYINLPLKSMDANFSSDNGFVIEFDITTFGEFPDGGVLLETGSVAGAYFPPAYFYMNGNGDICSNNKSTVLIPNAIVKGEWLHIIIVLEPDEFVYKLYVEGEYIATYDAKYNGTTTYNHNLVAFRISGSPSTSGEVAYDNLKIYAGDSYRDNDRLKNMSDDELFLYYVNYMNDADKEVFGKNSAYQFATSLLPNYATVGEDGSVTPNDYALANPKIAEAIESYVNFDLQALLSQVKADNIQKLSDLMNTLTVIDRSVDTVADRLLKAENINKFLDKNSGLIDLDADLDDSGTSDYVEITLLLEKIVKEIEYDQNSSLFVKFMTRFMAATTLSAKERYYNRAKQLLLDNGIDLDLINDPNHEWRHNFLELVDAYENYVNAKAELDLLTLENNAYTIILCVNRIKEYDTEEEWLANADEMNKYLNIIKPLILVTDVNGNPLYDVSYDGIDSAVRFFEEAYTFFFNLSQDTHVEYISGVLENILKTDSYIEKMGMTAAIERYVEVNELDYDDERIIKLLNDYDTCKSELVLREADYAQLLIQNSVYFTNLVEKMRTSDNYLDQRAYFEQAALLYFNIDATVEGTEKAIEIYEEYLVILSRIEESSVKFVEAVAIYNACETADDKYAALVECYYYAQYAEASFEGVAEAMAEYNSIYESYMTYADGVNADLAISGNAVGSVRANCGMTVIIAIIVKKIFGV